jgi:beta-lactam-binding protein with PASTA domain
VRVPSVVGKSLADARTALSARGLHAVVRGTCTSKVSQQKPAPGARAPGGRRVRLTC